MASPRPSFVEWLFAEHAGALQAFFRRRIQTKADAPDLAQEVYLRMLRISDQEGNCRNAQQHGPALSD